MLAVAQMKYLMQEERDEAIGEYVCTSFHLSPSLSSLRYRFANLPRFSTDRILRPRQESQVRSLHTFCSSAGTVLNFRTSSPQTALPGSEALPVPRRNSPLGVGTKSSSPVRDRSSLPYEAVKQGLTRIFGQTRWVEARLRMERGLRRRLRYVCTSPCSLARTDAFVV